MCRDRATFMIRESPPVALRERRGKSVERGLLEAHPCLDLAEVYVRALARYARRPATSEERAVALGPDLGIAVIRARPGVGPETEAELTAREVRR